MGMMSLEEAKYFFRSMKCSKFMMAREDLSKYEMYKALNISANTEMQWREEEFYRYYKTLNDNEQREKVWVIYNRMYDLLESTKNIDHMHKMHMIIKSLILDLSDIEKIIIAETINGRKQRNQRSGLVYLSFDLGEKELAKNFVEDSLNLLDISANDEDEEVKKRIEEAKILCNEINDELDL